MNKKVGWLLAGLVLVILALILVYYSQQKPDKTVVISGHPIWPPIMYQQGEEIIGAGPDIAKKIFNDLGITAVSRYEGNWEEVQGKARSGQVDVLAAAYKTAERETYMDYSIPYTVDPVVLVVKKGNAFSYDKWDDLVGKRGVVTQGDSYGQEFDAFLKETLMPQEVASPGEAFFLLESGEADYFVYALYSANDYIASNGVSEQFEILPNYVSSENFYLTISKASPFASLLPQVNELLEEYKEDGTIERIIEEHKQLLWSK